MINLCGILIKLAILFALLWALTGCTREGSTNAKPEQQPDIQHSRDPQPSDQPQKAEEPVRVLGDFSDVESNGEHQWGFSVEIWRQGGEVYGLISGNRSPMLVGDAPTGILEKVVYDEQSGKLSFRAALPGERYSFEGTLTEDLLEGRLVKESFNEADNIALKLDKHYTREMMDDFPTYEEWRSYADTIHKFRGPRQGPSN